MISVSSCHIFHPTLLYLNVFHLSTFAHPISLTMSSPITASSENLSLAGAKVAIAAAEAKARAMGIGMNIAVVDASVGLQDPQFRVPTSLQLERNLQET
jgi:hypothetical protein